MKVYPDTAEVVCPQLSELPLVVATVRTFLASARVWLLEGAMGAGKTTLVRELCRQWQVTDAVSSPTFGLVHEYRTAADEAVFHFDFYRIEDESEAVAIGTEEYFDSGARCLIEWPERIPNLIPPRHGRIEILVGTDDARTLRLHRV